MRPFLTPQWELTEGLAMARGQYCGSDAASDPNAYIYFTIQEQNWGPTCKAIGKPQWINDPAYATARARQPKIFDIFAEIEKWLADKTKFEAVEHPAQVRRAMRSGSIDEGNRKRSCAAC